MPELKATELRPAQDYGPEQKFLQARMGEIERDMGKVAAKAGRAISLTQPMDALDRARELVAELEKQVLIRPLDEAIATRMQWLDRVEARRNENGDDAMPQLNKVALDRRILGDILSDWESRR
jgi:hypothetical protein